MRDGPVVRNRRFDSMSTQWLGMGVASRRFRTVLNLKKLTVIPYSGTRHFIANSHRHREPPPWSSNGGEPRS